jgi:adenine-specific DNA-methyltransferase
MYKMKMQTPNLTDENFAALKAMFPSAVTEAINENGVVVRAIDKDVLAQEINAHVVEGREERYQFTWPDKKKSVLLGNAPIAATLRPCHEESINFDTTENLYIEGDNLDVLKLLRETYLNRVKMIYIDPPYNTGSDLVYEDDFSEDPASFLLRDGQYDDEGNRMLKNLDSNGRFHTDWLNMIYPRLRIARDLLADDGIIFISMDDNEIENLKKICNEIFGEGNFISDIVWEKRYTRNNDAKLMSTVVDHILLYRKSVSLRILREPRSEKQNSTYSNPDNDPRGVWTSVLFTSQRTKEERPNLSYPIVNPITGEPIEHPTNAWKYSKDKYEGLLNDNRLYWGVDGGNSYPRIKRFLSELDDGVVPINLWYYKDTATLDEGTKLVDSLLGKDVFDYPKPIEIVQRMLRIVADKDALAVDFFSGSATTAHAVMKQNLEDGGKRKFILVQLPEATNENSEAFKAGYKNICEIGKERIRRAGKKIQSEYERKYFPQHEISSGGGVSIQSGIVSLPDIGFRVLKLDDSNLKKVYYTPQEYTQPQFNFDGLVDNIKNDRSAEDLLFQVMIDLGVSLSSRIEIRSVRDKDVYFVNDGYLVACFEAVTDDIVTVIAKGAPHYVVFRDSSFASDSTLINFEQIFKTYSPSTQRRVL